MNLIDFKDTFRFVAPDARAATLNTAAQLRHLGIRHALAGDSAVSAMFEELVNEALAD